MTVLIAAVLAVSPAVCSPACKARVEMREYRQNPMPTCTWKGESGWGFGEWSMRRYRARNSSSTAAGKFQLIDQSAHAVGVPDLPGTHDAAKIKPRLQERAARRLLRLQGLGAWVLC